jgi:hypothetical protein
MKRKNKLTISERLSLYKDITIEDIIYLSNLADLNYIIDSGCLRDQLKENQISLKQLATELKIGKGTLCNKICSLGGKSKDSVTYFTLEELLIIKQKLNDNTKRIFRIDNF